MSNAPLTPPPDERAEAPSSVADEQIPPSGVRKMLDAFEERDLSRIRWSSVLGGLFLALGTLVLLGLLGFATGVSVLDPTGPAPLERLATGMGLWMAFASLVALFVGGFAAAKLGGSIRRGDGALAGALTWAVALALAMLVLGSGAPPLFGVTPSFEATTSIDAAGPAIERAQLGEPWGGSVRVGRGELVRAAWGTFVGAVISLLAASFGGVLGAVGRRSGARPKAPRPEGEDQIPLY